MQNQIQFDLTTAPGYGYRISAPCGKTCRVTLPPNALSHSITVSGCLGRRQVVPPPASASPVINTKPLQLHFEGFVGAAPSILISEFNISHDDNSTLYFDFGCRVTSSFEFTALTVVGNELRSIDPGTKSYEPYSIIAPLISSSEGACCVVNDHITSDQVDPGRFVAIA